MAMTKKQRRSVFIFGGLGVLALAVGLVLFALRDNIVFFYSPSDVISKNIPAGQRFRLGGLVEKGSIAKQGTETRFAITDTHKVIRVVYNKPLPDLFREEQGVVAEGVLTPDGEFIADNVLAKHDEKYMPPEVAAALKKRGVWKEGEKGRKKAVPEPVVSQ